MCGKSYVILTGSVSSVTAAIERAKAGVEDGIFLDSSVIAGPDERLWESIL
jgi:microcompartment protein CcmL/EutN